MKKLKWTDVVRGTKVIAWLCTAWRRIGGAAVQLHSLVTSTLNKSERSIQAPAAGERTPGTSRVGDWVGPRGGLDALKKTEIVCPCRNSNLESFSLSLHRLLYLCSALFLFFYCNSVYCYLNYINYTVYVILRHITTSSPAKQNSRIIRRSFQKWISEVWKLNK
jgi:hypothetical protein